MAIDQAPTLHPVAGGTVDPLKEVSGLTIRGNVLDTVPYPLPRVWLECDLKDTIWPAGADLSGMEFIDCDLSGSVWDGIKASDLRIYAKQRGSCRVHGMSMQNSKLPGLTMTRVVGLRLLLNDSDLDEASIRESSLIRLQAQRLHAEHAHFCAGTVMDDSDWEQAFVPWICFDEASLVGAHMRRAEFAGGLFRRVNMRNADISYSNFGRKSA